MRRNLICLASILITLAGPTIAQDTMLDLGGDHYAAGQNVDVDAVPHDAFAAGFNVRVDGKVAGDAHAAGFDVEVNQSIAGDLYAGGFTVDVAAPVVGDITAAGSSVTLSSDATIGGNARLAGASVTISAPIEGSALVSSDTLSLNSTIAGDFSFYGRSITFGPDAKVDGQLAIRAPEEIEVPGSVAEAGRVTYAQFEAPDYVSEAGRTAGSVVNAFWPAVWAALAWAAFLLLVGALFIALAPRLVTALERESGQRPVAKFGLGIVTFAAVLGLVPLAAMTIFGLLVLPFVLVFAGVACALANLAGVYLLGKRVGSAFRPINSNAARLAVLAVAVALMGLIGLIPFIGWLLALVLTTIGFGAIGGLLLNRPVPERGLGGPMVSTPAPGE